MQNSSVNMTNKGATPTTVDEAGAVMNSDTTTAAMQFVIDEDSMGSDSATKVPTQQSVKAYVDAHVGGATGDVATDEIWDAKGDLVVGTGANTAAKLAIGTDNYVLRVATDTPAWEAEFDATNPAALGTAAPGSAVTAARRDHVHTLPKLDDLAAPDANTDLNASTTAHGLVVAATAPDAGLINVVGIANAETTYTNKPLFDATVPSTQAFGDAAAAGTATVSARRDHKHAMPATPTTMANDALWDAAGDLAVGTGANTGGKLAVGATGTLLTVTAGTPAWTALGTLMVAASDATAAEKAAALASGGAVCDGTADDVQINAAITTLQAANGGTIYLSSGLFVISDPIIVPSGDPIAIIGSGRQATKIYGVEETSYITVGDASALTDNFLLKSVMLQDDALASNLLVLQNFIFAHVEDVYFWGIGGTKAGVTVDSFGGAYGAYNASFINCDFYSNTAGSTGILFTGDASNKANTNLVLNCRFRTPNGIYFEYGESNNIIASAFACSGIGVRIGAKSHYNVINGIYAEGAGTGIQIDSGALDNRIFNTTVDTTTKLVDNGTRTFVRDNYGFITSGETRTIKKTIDHADITDDAGASGHAHFDDTIPEGSIIKTVKIDYTEAFDSDNTSTLTIQVGAPPAGDADAYNKTASGEDAHNTTTDVFWGESDCQEPIVSVDTIPYITFTEDSDITQLISGAGAAGACTIYITYMKA